MPQLDVYHDTVKQTLIHDGWSITHDPFVLAVGKKRLFVDLGASQLISAEKDERKIAVEVKSFLGASDIRDLEQALGQYVLYYKILRQEEPDRRLYLAVSESTFESVFRSELGELLLVDQTIQLLVFDEEREVVTQWLPPWTTDN
jgi:hypothetical protein